MPQIGWFELLIIVIIAILVIGPKDFPIVLKKVGSWVGTIKRYFSDIQSNVNELTNMDTQSDKKKIKDNETTEIKDE
jgi:sec-independent protein translocase protein TatB